MGDDGHGGTGSKKGGGVPGPNLPATHNDTDPVANVQAHGEVLHVDLPQWPMEMIPLAASARTRISKVAIVA